MDHFSRILNSQNFVLYKLFLYFKQEVVKKPAPVNRYDRYDQERFDSQKGKMKLSVTLICDALRDLVPFVQLKKNDKMLSSLACLLSDFVKIFIWKDILPVLY